MESLFLLIDNNIYLANLKNFIANLLGNLEIFQGDLQISFKVPTTFLTSC